jgi:threonyl-tRNA synthetase
MSIQLEFPDGQVRDYSSGVTGSDIAISISEGLAKRTIAYKWNDRILDLSQQVPGDGKIRLLMPDDNDPDSVYVLRHSCAHVLAEAVCDLFPGTKLAYGPPLEDGFYYDLAPASPITSEHFEKIEQRMQEIVKENRPFTRCEYGVQEGLQRTAQDKYKQDNAQRAVNNGDHMLSFYATGCPGENWEDLCAGPHVPATGLIRAAKVMSVSGAYWHGDQNSDQLTRVYGTAFFDPKNLKKHLARLEEAKRRDHRRIGKELDLFHLEEHSPGMVFWHPKGASLYQTIQDYIRGMLRVRGYDEVRTPEIVEKTLWQKSGHLDNYAGFMFMTQSENREFAVKPMNCPCHIEIFKQGLKSFRDLPLRYAEFGKCHRNELAGTMHGIMRVRGFTQDDAHIFCTREQIESEVADFCLLVKEVYADFGFTEIITKFSTRPEKRIGSDEVWDEAEAALRKALDRAGMNVEINPGEGAFYGPKLEFQLKDCLGRTWQCGTIQVDFNLPERLGATFIGQDSQRQHPVMLHRAVLGSIERFMGILIEEYAGDFPLWLAPVQFRVVPVSEKFMDYARKVHDRFLHAGMRVELDARNEKIGYKVRESEKSRIPYVLIVGEKEQEAESIAIRKRKIGDLGVLPLEDAMKNFILEIADKKALFPKEVDA